MYLCARLELSAGRRTRGYHRSVRAIVEAGTFSDLGGLFLLIAKILLLPLPSQNACQRAGPGTELRRLRGLGWPAAVGQWQHCAGPGGELGARPRRARASAPHKFPLFCHQGLLTKELPRTVRQEE